MTSRPSYFSRYDSSVRLFAICILVIAVLTILRGIFAAPALADLEGTGLDHRRHRGRGEANADRQYGGDRTGVGRDNEAAE